MICQISLLFQLITCPTQPPRPEQCPSPSPDAILPIPTSRPTKYGPVPASPTRLLRSEASNAGYAASTTSSGWRGSSARSSTQAQIWKTRISGKSLLLRLTLRVLTPFVAAWYCGCYGCRVWSRLCCREWNY